jgi:hypothetical protein
MAGTGVFDTSRQAVENQASLQVHLQEQLTTKNFAPVFPLTQEP